MSDNGGRAVPGGDSRSSPNHPLRGSKGSVYEGGTKVPGFIHSPLLGAASGTRCRLELSTNLLLAESAY